MSNPFEYEDSNYLVLMNDEGQYSLWPASIPVPAGWTQMLGKAKRRVCLDYIAEQWTDLKPLSLCDETGMPGMIHEVGR
ncbi:MbtH family protein [Paenibacillus amylolyticus]|uniref:MbtH family protein n=1 Tax=Paenibacillus amylolyticus TaxID=1451 RepID=A0A100VQK4_PAEAM|nr:MULTISPECIES: MbtH family protein [Paenibacillus]MCW3793137.1 MbtH family protein [Paenibacillus sp. LS1]OMF13754.1 MbtH family protein [Paenibacillus amylolyticus]OMF62998.1 MbtH family protein [Paenibacillus sp. FSL R5-0765]GAS84232.1 MbtH-like protein [Paenibacillus amylolyticus]